MSTSCVRTAFDGWRVQVQQTMAGLYLHRSSLPSSLPRSPPPRCSACISGFQTAAPQSTRHARRRSSRCGSRSLSCMSRPLAQMRPVARLPTPCARSAARLRSHVRDRRHRARASSWATARSLSRRRLCSAPQTRSSPSVPGQVLPRNTHARARARAHTHVLVCSLRCRMYIAKEGGPTEGRRLGLSVDNCARGRPRRDQTHSALSHMLQGARRRSQAVSSSGCPGLHRQQSTARECQRDNPLSILWE